MLFATTRIESFSKAFLQMALMIFVFTLFSGCEKSNDQREEQPLLKTSQQATQQLDGEINIGLSLNSIWPVANFAVEALNGANLALDEINQNGGILGKKVNLITRETQLKSDIARRNVIEMIEQDDIKMIMNDAVSSMALAITKVSRERKIIFMPGTVYASNITGEFAHRYCFRVTYNATMHAKALASYLNRQFKNKKYFYITWDYVWGWDIEQQTRTYTDTTDAIIHKRFLIPYPDYKKADIEQAIETAKKERPDVIVVVLYGSAFSEAMQEIAKTDLKNKAKIVVNTQVTHQAIKEYGTKIFEKIIGSTFFDPAVPYNYNYKRGIQFVENYLTKYNMPPGVSSSSIYTAIYQYKAAVEKAGTFETETVVDAMEKIDFQILKGIEHYRKFDHQNIQDVYVVKFKTEQELKNGRFPGDKWNILRSEHGSNLVISRDKWNQIRAQKGLSTDINQPIK